jgi:matrixin
VGNYGKDTQHYFITSSASGYASYINTAMSEWVNTTSSMGVTTMYNGSTEVDPFSSNWAWGKIQLDADFSDLSENKRLAVIAHEMGHVMGLAHSDFSNVLMRADIAYNSSSTSRAQTNDLGGINYLYK